MRFSNVTLMKIASIGGIITVSMGFATRHKINNNISKTEYYKEALKMLRAHKGAIHILGEPIKDCSLDVTDQDRNYTKEFNAHYEVPVKGPKQRGVLYFWAERLQGDEKWTVNRIELELKDDLDRRLLIKSDK